VGWPSISTMWCSLASRYGQRHELYRHVDLCRPCRTAGRGCSGSLRARDGELARLEIDHHATACQCIASEYAVDRPQRRRLPPPQPTSHTARKMDKNDNIRRRSASTTRRSQARDSLVLVRQREPSHLVGIKAWHRVTHPCQRGTSGALSLMTSSARPSSAGGVMRSRTLPDDLR
jgi:hypothetical protein